MVKIWNEKKELEIVHMLRVVFTDAYNFHEEYRSVYIHVLIHQNVYI